MIRSFLPAILSLLVMGAHFLRLGNILVVVLLVVCIGLLTVQKPWAAYTIQTLLVLGVLQWLLTIGGIASTRMAGGEPWMRMAIILGTVTAFTAYAAWHFRHPKLRAWFGTGAVEPPAPA